MIITPLTTSSNSAQQLAGPSAPGLAATRSSRRRCQSRPRAAQLDSGRTPPTSEGPLMASIMAAAAAARDAERERGMMTQWTHAPPASVERRRGQSPSIFRARTLQNARKQQPITQTTRYRRTHGGRPSRCVPKGRQKPIANKCFHHHHLAVAAEWPDRALVRPSCHSDSPRVLARGLLCSAVSEMRVKTIDVSSSSFGHRCRLLENNAI